MCRDTGLTYQSHEFPLGKNINTRPPTRNVNPVFFRIHPYAHPLINLTPSAQVQMIKKQPIFPEVSSSRCWSWKAQRLHGRSPFTKTLSYILHWTGHSSRLPQIFLATQKFLFAKPPKLIDHWSRSTAETSAFQKVLEVCNGRR
ncbi:hypothetical protein AVEN_166745-1 [Araneus ventricosus]|uniref:Uncharacterized protein n=1 Tax=Araneus ventricosus TaxID=182803 RepID=A0A4Y2BPQ9_ARAVE|nr:hypothetical protein AVEN_166745-1 [Araneus ventricosus]